MNDKLKKKNILPIYRDNHKRRINESVVRYYLSRRQHCRVYDNLCVSIQSSHRNTIIILYKSNHVEPYKMIATNRESRYVLHRTKIIPTATGRRYCKTNNLRDHT